jgi:sortase A
MRDKRPVDELSIDELERILAVRKREARQERLRRYENQGRRLPSAAAPVEPPPQQHEAAEHLAPPEPPVTYDLTDEVPRFEDDLDEEIEIMGRKQPKPGSNGHQPKPHSRKKFDRLLLMVEVLAVLGIVAVLAVGGYLLAEENNRLEALDKKSAEIQEEAAAMRPTPSPAPELSIRRSDYVLPGGHYSPDVTNGIGVFNGDELPESVRPAILAQLSAPQQIEAVAPQPLSPVRIEIPGIEVRANIYSGDDWFSMEKGVGHLTGSANPGEQANMVLSAHNDIYGEIFRKIEFLQPGDQVIVEANNGQRFTYVVTDKQVVEPDETWVLERGNQAIVTLITCHPYRVDTHRMVVFAELQPS